MIKFLNSRGEEEVFDSKKIKKSIVNAMKSGSGVYNDRLASLITEEANDKFSKKEIVNHSDVDKFVLKKLFEYGQDLTANAFERYKTAKSFQQIENNIDKDVYGIVDGSNVGAINENSNKDAQLISTDRKSVV